MAAIKGEKPIPLGDRVYKKHREMLRFIMKKLGGSRAEITRRAIEELHARITTNQK